MTMLSILIEDFNWDILTDKIIDNLALLKKQFYQNVLPLNVSKTKFMPISQGNRGELTNKINLHNCGNTKCKNCNCSMIGKIISYKYLGGLFDNQLTWTDHILFLNTKNI